MLMFHLKNYNIDWLNSILSWNFTVLSTGILDILLKRMHNQYFFLAGSIL